MGIPISGKDGLYIETGPRSIFRLANHTSNETSQSQAMSYTPLTVTSQSQAMSYTPLTVIQPTCYDCVAVSYSMTASSDVLYVPHYASSHHHLAYTAHGIISTHWSHIRQITFSKTLTSFPIDVWGYQMSSLMIQTMSLVINGQFTSCPSFVPFLIDIQAYETYWLSP